MSALTSSRAVKVIFKSQVPTTINVHHISFMKIRLFGVMKSSAVCSENHTDTMEKTLQVIEC
jgi:hypothetical protein